MCRTSATLPRIRWAAGVCLTVSLACCLAAGSQPTGRTLFLLAGTLGLNDTSQTFPARLYTVDPQHRLRLFRTVVPGDEGITAVLGDTRGRIYVAFPSDLAFPAPTKISVVHERQPRAKDIVSFDPGSMAVWEYALATAAGPGLESRALLPLFQEPPSTVKGHAAFMRYVSRATTLVAVAGDAPASGPRVTQNDWALYRDLTYSGSPGGPGFYPPPHAAVENRDLVMRLGGKVVTVDRAPPLPEGSPGTIWILAASSRFVVSVPLHFAGGNYTVPAVLYVHGRQTGTWRKLESAGSMPQCRIFGPWLATRVRDLEQSATHRDTNPGHGAESHLWVRDERPDVRTEYEDLDSAFRIPGTLTLDNLVDGRRITLDTHEEDSEILDVRSDGLLLYRVNDEIFSAQIEGDKLSAPTLVVKGEDVPEVHWAFWSNAPAEPAPTGKPAAGR
jgi:hypothetical protein